jgi:hypothetical protein
MLNKFTPEQAKAIIEKSRKTLSRPVLQSGREERREDYQATESPPVDGLPPSESVNARHRRELAEQEKRFELERQRERAAQDRIARERARHADSVAEQRIAELEAKVIELAKACRSALAALEAEIARVSGENLDLKSRFELQLKFADSAGGPIEIPRFLQRMQ